MLAPALGGAHRISNPRSSYTGGWERRLVQAVNGLRAGGTVANAIEHRDGHDVSLELPCTAVSGVPTGIRTPVTAVKGRCPRPLDDGDEAGDYDCGGLVVELSGIEPLTSCMPCKRSPS